MDRYNHLNSYLRNKFGSRVLKVCIDGGFTCPNRDGSKSTGGCIFCARDGAGEIIKYKRDNCLESIKSQVENFLNSYRGERADKFIAYFQAFSNTYDSVENLKLKYDLALSCSDKFVGLEIATRPDLIDDEIAKLLASYLDNYYVCVELGLQTANDDIGTAINREYTSSDFERACEILKKYNIDVVAHLMVGLPGETQKDILDTVDIINNCKCSGIKIHSTYVVKDTVLSELYLKGKYTPITEDYYVRMVGKIISMLDDKIIVHRINADPPRELFLAPDWQLHKKLVINHINKYLDQENIVQGSEYDSSL